MSMQCVRCGAATMYTSEQGVKQGRGGVLVGNLGDRMVVPISYRTEIGTTYGTFFNRIVDAQKLRAIEQMWSRAE